MSITASHILPTPTARLIPPTGERTGWIAQRADGTLLRIGADAATLLESLADERDRDQLVVRLGAPWTADAVDAALASLGSAGLLDTGERPAAVAPPPRRLRFVPPAALQLTLVRDPEVLNALRGRLTWVVSRPVVALGLLLAVVGLIVLAARHADVVSAATSPLSPAAIAAVVLTTIFVTSLHELAHGATLVAYGGRVRRFGVMIFYASLAMFCDVTDAWLLNSRRSARNVALAGGLASISVAGTCSLVAAATAGSVATVLTLVAIIAYVSAIVNLIPLIKLDGYVALVLAKGESNLRRRAMDGWVDALAGRPVPAPPTGWDRAGLIAFGVGCSLFPVVLVGATAVEASRSLEHWGRLGAIGQLVIAALVGALAVHRAIRFVRRARGRGLPWAAPLAALVALVTATLTLGLAARASVIETIPYSQRGESVVLAVALTAPHLHLAAGQPLTLDSVGLLASRRVGTARVTSSQADRATVPGALRSPAIRVGGGFTTRVIHATAAPHAPRFGYARVSRGHATVLSRGVHEFFLNPIQQLGS